MPPKAQNAAGRAKYRPKAKNAAGRIKRSAKQCWQSAAAARGQQRRGSSRGQGEKRKEGQSPAFQGRSQPLATQMTKETVTLLWRA